VHLTISSDRGRRFVAAAAAVALAGTTATGDTVVRSGSDNPLIGVHAARKTNGS
jgi:hypothetical protein